MTIAGVFVRISTSIRYMLACRASVLQSQFVMAVYTYIYSELQGASATKRVSNVMSVAEVRRRVACKLLPNS